MHAVLFVVMLGSAGCDELCTGEAFRQYGFLLMAAQAHSGEIEHGAFLVRRPDGTLALLLWPPGGPFSTSHSGKIPRGVLAVVHTHPPNEPYPSYHDTEEARRIGLPIIVLTREAVSVAWPDGTTSYLAERAGWQRSR